MKSERAIGEEFRQRHSQLVLPKLSFQQGPASSMSRTGSLDNILLPKLPQRLKPALKSVASPIQLLNKPSQETMSSPLLKTIPALSDCVKSSKPQGVVQLYCANTNKGIVRDYNEDRVMIMLRIPKPVERKDERWPPCSFFGLYDGHGGKTCSNFLRDNLHTYIIQDTNFPNNPQQAIESGFKRTEAAFLELAINKKNKSGSCAVVVLIVGKKAYVANLGDSRALISCNGGKEAAALTKDHKPSDKIENIRIAKAGGSVYYGNEQSVCRIMPGRLAISRAFGDVEAKVKEYGGNPHVLIAEPEINTVRISKAVDFIAIGSDGIFDRLGNQEVVDIIWGKSAENIGDPMTKLEKGVRSVILEAMNRCSYDNVTLLVVAFESFVAKSGSNSVS